MNFRPWIIIILQIFLLGCGKHYQKKSEKFDHYDLRNKQSAARFNDAIAGYKAKLEKETGRFIGETAGEITKDGAETTLGNFVCDALKYSAQKYFKRDSIDIVIVNRGGLRTNLPKGKITVGNIFELMPFENEMVLIKIKGAYLEQFFRLEVEKAHPFWGFTMKIKNKEVENVLVGGRALDKDKIYTLVTSDYLAGGGDNFVFLSKGEPGISGIKIRDAIIDYCEYIHASDKKITPYTDGRLEISK
jgi:2',3'-cyclic-nucleotide 2'-phosphodiesterase (5'-nucleotidase family)